MRTTWTSLKSRNLPVQRLSVEVWSGDPFVSHVHASGVFFHWVYRPYCVVQFWVWPLHLLLCPSRKCPRCSFAICDEQRSVFPILLLLEAIHLHCTEGLMNCGWSTVPHDRPGHKESTSIRCILPITAALFHSDGRTLLVYAFVWLL